MSSLKEEYRKAVILEGQLEGRPDSPEYQQRLFEGLDAFKLCKQFVNGLSLFSDNESPDDLATSDIQYLAVEYYLGKLTEKIQPLNVDNRIANRIEIINQAVEHYTTFLSQLDSYKLLPESSSKRLREILSTDGGLPKLSNVQSSDPTTRRADKIERFKMEKALQEKLQNVRSTDDEEVQRKVHFAQLGLLSIKTFSTLESINMELQLLNEQSKQPDQPANSTERNVNTDPSEYVQGRLDPSLDKGPLLNKFGKINRPFTIVSSRDQIKKGVQGTGQYLPTMTVDEYLEEERRQGRIIEGGGEESAKQGEPDEDDEEKHDRETYEARRWDEFTENNPKGSGNTMNIG